MVDIGGYSAVGPKDIILLDDSYTTASTTLKLLSRGQKRHAQVQQYGSLQTFCPAHSGLSCRQGGKADVFQVGKEVAREEHCPLSEILFTFLTFADKQPGLVFPDNGAVFFKERAILNPV